MNIFYREFAIYSALYTVAEREITKRESAAHVDHTAAVDSIYLWPSVRHDYDHRFQLERDAKKRANCT